MSRWVLCALALLAAAPLAGQGVDRQIRRNQARLDSIRQELGNLEDELSRLRGRERNIASELANIERQRLTTTRLVSELDRQWAALTAQLDTITVDLLVAENALAEKRAIQQARIVEIYKRGPLWSVQVLLSAESFGDLLSRYKYLYLVSRQDQALVTEVEDLRNRIARERRNLSVIEQEVAQNRRARESELERYQRLERDRQRTLSQTRSSAERARARIATLNAAETEISNLLEELERRRRADVAAGRVTLTPTITTASRGRLPWPVEGPLIYHFGPNPGPTGTVIPYLGIGIRTPPGTPVRAVADGMVELARPYGTYGNMVMLNHGGGFYTVYLYLSAFTVQPEQRIAQGDIIGRSGGEASEEGAHVQFQLFRAVGPSRPQAVDPLGWLVDR